MSQNEIVYEKEDGLMMEKNEGSERDFLLTPAISDNKDGNEVQNWPVEDRKNDRVVTDGSIGCASVGRNVKTANRGLDGCLDEDWSKDHTDEREGSITMTDEMEVCKETERSENYNEEESCNTDGNKIASVIIKEENDKMSVLEMKVYEVMMDNETVKKCVLRDEPRSDVVVGDGKTGDPEDIEEKIFEKEVDRAMVTDYDKRENTKDLSSNKKIEAAPSLKEEYLLPVKNLNFLLTELSFLIKSLKSGVIRQSVINYVSSIDKEVVSRLYFKYIAHIKLIYKLKVVYNTYNGDECFFSRISVILRLYFRMSEEIVRFVGDIFGKDQDELKDVLKCFEKAYAELKNLDIMDYLEILEDNGSLVSIKDAGCDVSSTEAAREFDEEAESNTEVKDVHSAMVLSPVKLPILNEEEKKIFCELFEMSASVLSHFILAYVFVRDVRDYIVINQD
ncbi:hypothetical protein VCUG_00290 [Vavraia culicis subsp. floridensis]|uniref:Uncharacterized protein n=1 Tax=Vavraia culicis (isolate floridensis) TaxID=948595 RepID=L2GX78_VAVCU|nr:uncharacterized protein VCUG_00290 [Vavraia culicis subsp. floridensis]ELA48249.1 hypothetical protein VCUG_00290 [Vavraia culicis subsp. floridensis]